MGGDQRVSRLEAMFANVLGPLSLRTLSKEPPASGVQLLGLGLRVDDDDDDSLLFSADPDWLELGDVPAAAEDNDHQVDEVDEGSEEDAAVLLKFF